MDSREIARRYYRLGLAAAKRRDLTAALRYALLSDVLSPKDGDNSCHEDAARLAEICRSELGDTRDPAFERIALLVKQKKWVVAARAAGAVSDKSVKLLNIQGCLWALAGRYAPAMDCFGKALAKDRRSILAADALAELARRRKSFWRFFCFSLVK
jgi:tetratricopeptide (TPR) repeat protein